MAIADLSNSGDGVGRWEGRVVFVPNAVPGDRALVRLVRVKPQYAHGKLHQLLEASPHRVQPDCSVSDKCGGYEWQFIDYNYQLQVKREQIVDALERIGSIENPPVDDVLASVPWGYRNKATFPLGVSASGQVQAGYYQKGSHRLVNLDQCPIQDVRLNPLLAEVKQDLQRRGWLIYNETTHQGKLRHLALRIGRRTGEILLTLVTTDWQLPGISEQAEEWLSRYPQLVGVALNRNGDRTNVIFGSETRCIAGRPYTREIFAELEFQIRPTTFFQVNTEQAEALLQVIMQQLNLQGNEVLLDAYCGIGTLTLPLAKQVQQAIGLEVQSESVEQASLNAALNGIENVSFKAGAVEDLLPKMVTTAERNEGTAPAIVLLDPPRKGCDPAVINALLQSKPNRIVYVSCNPSTLARDLKLLCQAGNYRLTRVQPADFFPQTPHVECAAFLSAASSN
ncbi:23S rRNA (uracil(1939)-C(5))-methyltransferase RlmD [Oculatella sp. FACHB-28]|nr:23S rRNA (uracil(1939)-C(5))-methyltransferase RlmD [Oculatella sp. FACHB-28]